MTSRAESGIRDVRETYRLIDWLVGWLVAWLFDRNEISPKCGVT